MFFNVIYFVGHGFYLFFKAVEMGHKISSVSDFIRLEGNMLVAAIVTKFAKCALVPTHLWVPLDTAF